jgi:OOP family OmpA-OmpF porin
LSCGIICGRAALWLSCRDESGHKAIRSAAMRTGLMIAIALTVALFAIVPAVAIPRIERNLAARAADALRREGVDWATLSVRASTLRIEGEAPAAGLRDQVIALLASLDGVAEIIDGTTVAPARSYAIQAVRVSDLLTVSGSVPDQALADAVLAAIAGAAPGLAIEVVPGEVDAAWREAAVAAADRAARLLEGTVALTEDSLTVTGSVADLETAEIVQSALGGESAPALSVDVVLLAPRLYQLSVTREQDRLVLAGEAPDSFARDALVALAQRQGVPRVDAEGLVIVPGVATEEWHRLAGALIRHVGAMQQAVAQLEPGKLTLDGIVADPQMAELTRNALASIFGQQEGMRLAIEIRTPEATPPVEEPPADTRALLAWADSAPVPAIADDQLISTSDCQRALNALIADSRIRFVGDSADLDPAGQSVLEAVALTIRRCPDAQVEVSGHTEASDDPAASEAISAARAEAVVDYLVRRGVDESRLIAAGYGDLVPIADNATAEGRERNRRIEFLVVPAQ